MQSYKRRFSLSDEQYDSLPKYPTIALSLPDGSSLRAVAIDDENFPAINVYWDTEKPGD